MNARRNAILNNSMPARLFLDTKLCKKKGNILEDEDALNVKNNLNMQCIV